MSRPSNTVRIVAHTFILPNGDLRRVEVEKKATSRLRAEQYVQKEVAEWEDKQTQEAIYFLDPLEVQHRIEDRRSGAHGWHVGDCGGSGLVKAFSSSRDGRRGRRGLTGGYRVLMTGGGEHSFMDAN